MSRQLLRDSLDAPDHAAFEISGSEVGFHRLAYLFPIGGADLGVDAAIGHDLDVAIGEQQIDQHAIVVRCVPNTKMRENIERPLARGLTAKQRRTIQRTLNHESDLAA